MAPPTEASFQNFSFDATSRTNQALRNVSPLAPSYSPSPVSSSDLNLLTQQFSQQTLNDDPRSSRAYNYPSNYVQQGYSSSSSLSTQPYQQNFQCPHWTAQSARSQRQASTRLQYDPSRTGEASTLVDRMVASGEQCSICAAQSQRAYTYIEPRQDYRDDEFTDEGIDMTPANFDENYSHGLAYRRSMEFSPEESRVQRPVRIRKNRRRGND